MAVTARFVPRGTAQSLRIWEALELRHGETVRTLRTLPDFMTVLLEPLRARIVMGFALTTDIDGPVLRSALN